MRILFTVVALAASALLTACSREPASPVAALMLPDGNELPEFTLVDQREAIVDRSVFEGQWDLVFFGFTHCPDICPTTLQVLAAAKKKLAEDGHSPLPRIVLVSVDPERDTPALMGQYVNYFGEGNLGITGSLEETRVLTKALGIYFEKHETDGDNYAVDHSAAVLVIDPAGKFSALFTGPHKVDDYVHDLPLLMVEQ